MASSAQKEDENTACPQVNDDQNSFNRNFTFSNNLSLEDIRKIMCQFISERNWDQFHAPRNVLLALMGEVGELSEIFQWKGEVKEGLPGWSDEERHHLGQELSDVLMYLIDLAYRCQIDLPKALIDKVEHNAKKYPIEKAYGSSKKYSEYE